MVPVGTVSKPTTLPSDGTFAATDRDIREPFPSRRKTIALTAAAGVAVLIAGIAIGSMRQPGAPATGTSSSAASAAPTPTPTPTPEPPATTTPAVPPSPTPSQPAKPPATPTTKPTAKPTTKHAPSKACDPPYTVGKDGVKKPKLECL
jgi:hypothetical protein